MKGFPSISKRRERGRWIIEIYGNFVKKTETNHVILIIIILIPTSKRRKCPG